MLCGEPWPTFHPPTHPPTHCINTHSLTIYCSLMRSAIFFPVLLTLVTMAYAEPQPMLEAHGENGDAQSSLSKRVPPAPVVCFRDRGCTGDSPATTPGLRTPFGPCGSVDGNKGLSFCPTCTPKDVKKECHIWKSDTDCIEAAPDKTLSGCVLVMPRNVSVVTVVTCRPVLFGIWC